MDGQYKKYDYDLVLTERTRNIMDPHRDLHVLKRLVPRGITVNYEKSI